MTGAELRELVEYAHVPFWKLARDLEVSERTLRRWFKQTVIYRTTEEAVKFCLEHQPDPNRVAARMLKRLGVT